MFYEEKMIDGVLHWRNIPGGQWVDYTAAQLSQRYVDLQKEHFKANLGCATTQELIDELEARIHFLKYKTVDSD